MKRLFLAMAAIAAMLLPASSALAAPHNPTGEYAQFADCPLSKATVNFCIYSKSSAGFFTIGKKTVPIVNPVVLQGGLEFDTQTGANTFYAAEDGNTLVRTPQPVPGGLLGIQAPSWWPSLLRNLFNETINNGSTGVTATVELAAPASSIQFNLLNLIETNGTAISLPIKIKLSNPFLGNNCYIGSNTNPIVLALTAGTTSPPPPNEPIRGRLGEFAPNEAGTILTINNNRLVNNSFAAPGARGCGGLFAFLVDPFVDSIVGLPSPAGTNTAVLEGKLQLAQREAVIASE